MVVSVPINISLCSNNILTEFFTLSRCIFTTERSLINIKIRYFNIKIKLIISLKLIYVLYYLFYLTVIN